ncbi:MAG: hypothetical protein AAF436_10895 [Myxococcota bacterium]
MTWERAGGEVAWSQVQRMVTGAAVGSLLVLAGCGWWRGAEEGSPGHVSEANQACATLFCTAEEQERTEGQCAPSCKCGQYTFAEATYDEHDIHALQSWRLLNPPAVLPLDPYEDPAWNDAIDDDAPAFCAAIPVDASPEKRTYRLETFPTEPDATRAGGQVTHRGKCGACSSLQDLAVYIERRDLGSAGRNCGLLGTFGDRTQMSCLKGLGFTDPCAQIWSFNVDNTRGECLGLCTVNLPADNTVDNGSLNACLACDEKRSGPIFKAVAGRTRRRSGLSSAIARPCLDERGQPAVYAAHHYYFDRQASGGASAGGSSSGGSTVR